MSGGVGEQVDGNRSRDRQRAAPLCGLHVGSVGTGGRRRAQEQVGEAGPEGVVAALELAQVGVGGGEGGVVEGVLDVLDGGPDLAQQPGVAVAEGVDGPRRR